MLVVRNARRKIAYKCRVECEMSGHGNWWVRSMKTPSLGNSACAKIGRVELGRPALSSTERVNLELVNGSLGVSGMCRRRSQCHLGGVSKGRGSPWERGDEDRMSESTQEDCWMKQARYRYVSHTLLWCACAQNMPGTESWL